MRFDHPYTVVSVDTTGQEMDRAEFNHRDDAVEFARYNAENCGMDTYVLSLEASYMAPPEEDPATMRGVVAGLDFPATLTPGAMVHRVA